MNLKRKIIILSAIFLFLSCIGAYWLLKAPKVSIVMPVYNGAQYLEQTIGFLLQSKYKDFEFVIIDDGSTDDSWEKLQKIAKQDSRIKLYKNEKNMGIVKTRNRGFELARGEYIAPMDQDDWSLPDRLKLEVEYLDKHPDVAIVDVGTILLADYYQGIKDERMGAISWLMETGENEKKHYSLDERDENIKLSLFFSCAVPTQSAAMMRRSWFDKHQVRYTEGVRYADDYYLYADMIKKGARFHHIEDIAHIYNDVREHSVSFVQKQIDEVNAVKRELYQWAGIDFDNYLNMNVEEFVCAVLRDMLDGDEAKLRFSKELLEKNQRLLCLDKPTQKNGA